MGAKTQMRDELKLTVTLQQHYQRALTDPPHGPVPLDPHTDPLYHPADWILPGPNPAD